MAHLCVPCIILNNNLTQKEMKQFKNNFVLSLFVSMPSRMYK